MEARQRLRQLVRMSQLEGRGETEKPRNREMSAEHKKPVAWGGGKREERREGRRTRTFGRQGV